MNHLNTELCKECGGQCCKRMPGLCLPSDFGKTEDEMIKNLSIALLSKNYSIDWYEGDPKKDKDELDKVEFIRPAIKGEYKLYNPSWGGECVFLLDNGCKLQPEDRPYECRMIKPKKPTFSDCEPQGISGKQFISIEWLKFKDIINNAIKINEGKVFDE